MRADKSPVCGQPDRATYSNNKYHDLITMDIKAQITKARSQVNLLGWVHTGVGECYE